MAIELFAHNKTTYHNMLMMFEKSSRVGVVQPTGTGKSFLYLKWIEDHPQDTFAILSPSTEIFTQLQEYAEASGTPELLKTVQMISYQTLLKMSDDEVRAIHPDKMVLDEFHRTGAELWGPSLQRLLDANPNTQVLGASATPVRYLDNSKDMASELFDRNLAVEMTLGEAVQRKILPTPIYVPVWYDVDGTMDRYQKDISRVPKSQERRELEDKLEQLKRRLENSYGADDIFQKHMPHAHGKYIVFCRSKEHLEEMKETVRGWLSGVNSNVRSYVSISRQEDKDIQLQAFKDDKGEDAIKLLFTIDRLNEGLHVKGIDGVIMLRPTTSPIIYLQQMGRALSVGYEKPLIFDIVNNYQSVQIPMKDGSSVNVFEKEFRDAMEQNGDLEIFRIFGDMRDFSSLFDELETVLYQSYDERWNDVFQLYCEFKQEHGREPKQRETYKGSNLGTWADTQRRAFKKGLLSFERKQKLLAVGFAFDLDPDDAAWQSTFEIYKEFRQNSAQDPKIGEIFKGVNLRNWVNTQRKAFKNGTLLEARKEQLLSIGFAFDRYEAKWQEFYTRYIEFKKEFNCEPKSGEMYKGINLGSWVDRQRHAFKKGTLSESRISRLLEAGFVFIVGSAQVKDAEDLSEE